MVDLTAFYTRPWKEAGTDVNRLRPWFGGGTTSPEARVYDANIDDIFVVKVAFLDDLAQETGTCRVCTGVRIGPDTILTAAHAFRAPDLVSAGFQVTLHRQLAGSALANGIIIYCPFVSNRSFPAPILMLQRISPEDDFCLLQATLPGKTRFIMPNSLQTTNDNIDVMFLGMNIEPGRP